MDKVKEMLGAKMELRRGFQRALTVLDVQGMILTFMMEQKVNFEQLSKDVGWSDEKMAEFFDKGADPSLRDLSDILLVLGREFRVKL